MGRLAGGLAVALLVACGTPDRVQQSVGPSRPTITISPTGATVASNARQQFTATVSGSTEAVAWAVSEGASGGTISSSGLYAAPAAPGVYHVAASLPSDSSVTAMATVTVTANPVVSITINPASVVLQLGAPQSFTATVTGATNTGVVWSVQESDGGSIDGHGNYTAPPSPGTFHVLAASIADRTSSAAATVTVQASPPSISISISPTNVALQVGSPQLFTATVTGALDQTVVWTVQEAAAGGAVDGSGLYVAPATAGTYHVVATSHSDTTKSATATVTVTSAPLVAISISPKSTTVAAGASAQFRATVTGTADTGAIWSVQEGPTGGSVDGSGNYIAPGSAGTYHVVATSHADTSKSDTATVTVAPNSTTISIDPSSITTWPGAQAGFAAKVTTGPATRVVWSVQEASGGQIDVWGNYTAPSTTGVYHVKAANQSSGESAVATVTVTTAGIVVTIDGASHVVVSLHDHVSSIALNATVHGTTDQAVTWAALDGGSISISGSTSYFTVPTTVGTYHVQATSHADPTAKAVLIVEVTYDDLIDFGGPVLPSSHTAAIWWGPKADFPTDAVASVETYLSGLNGTSYLSMLAQYMRGAGVTTKFDGSLFDISSPPTSAPSTGDVAGEVCAVLDANGVTPRSDGIYAVYTSNFATQSGPLYCGWHSWSSCHGTAIQIALLPNPSNSPCSAAPELQCNQVSTAASDLIMFTAHELAEAMTDPTISAWFTNDGLEVADKCVYDPRQCISVGGTNWELPALWSNSIHNCAHQ